MHTLEEFRNKIDELDFQITKLLIQRFEIVEQIGRYKQIHSLSVWDKNREEEKIKSIKLIAEKQGSSHYSSGLSEIYQQIFRYSKQIQTENQ